MKRIRLKDQWIDRPEDVISVEELRSLAGVQPSRSLVRRTQDGAFLVPPSGQVRLVDGDQFDDAPSRIKGAE